MRRFRLLAGFTLFSFLLSACDSTTPEEYVERARVSFEHGDYQISVIELKNALQQQPDLGAARTLLGLAHVELGEYAGGLRELERAKDLGESGDALTIALLSAKNRTGRYQEVIGELAEVQQLSPELTIVLADAYLAGKDLKRAERLYQQSLSEASSNLGLGTIAWIQGDNDKARTLLSDAVAMAPSNREAVLSLAEFEFSSADIVAAENYFRQATQLPGGAVPGELGLARTALAQEKLEPAAGYVSSVLEAAPQLSVARYLDALIRFQQEDFDGAESALLEVQRVTPDHPPSLYLMGAVKYRQGQWFQAQHNLRRYLSIDPGNESASKLLASVYLQQGELDEVVDILGVFRETTTDAQLLAMIGTAELRLGRSADATQALERAVSLAPDAAAFRNQLALSLVSSGEIERAKGTLTSAIEVDGDQIQSEYLLAMLRIQDRDFPAALVAIDALIEKSPDNPIGFNLKGNVLLAQGDRPNAAAAFARALQLDPAYFPAAVNLARLDLQHGDAAAARIRYENVLAADSANTEARLALADLLIEQGEGGQAEMLLEETITSEPDAIAPRVRLIRLLMTQDRHAEAIRKMRPALELAGQSPSAELELLAAQLDLHKGDLASARARAETIQRLVAEREQPVAVLTTLGALQTRTGQLAPARQNFELALTNDSDNFQAALGLARIALHERHVEEVKRHLHSLQALKPDDPAVVLLQADVLQLDREFNAARAIYQQLAAAGNREAVIRLLTMSGSREDLIAALSDAESWIASNPADSGVRLLRAEGLLRAGQYDQAIAGYEQFGEQNNAMILNNLAWLYQQQGDSRALETARRAYDLAPENADVSDTLGWILLSEGQPQEALDYIQQSLQLNPENASVRYHLGRAHLAIGDHKAAAAALRQALELGNFPERDSALTTLADLSDV